MMKRPIAILVFFTLTAMLLTGCTININKSKNNPDIAETLANNKLRPDPVKYDPDGAYRVTFHFDEGGFEKMDLSQAYVAYYPYTVMDQIETITSDDGSDEIPPLPSDAQTAIDEVTGADRLEKIAVITIETVDDKTVNVAFTDKDDPIQGKEYFFIIPNIGISGSVIPD